MQLNRGGTTWTARFACRRCRDAAPDSLLLGNGLHAGIVYTWDVLRSSGANVGTVHALFAATLGTLLLMRCCKRLAMSKVCHYSRLCCKQSRFPQRFMCPSHLNHSQYGLCVAKGVGRLQISNLFTTGLWIGPHTATTGAAGLLLGVVHPVDLEWTQVTLVSRALDLLLDATAIVKESWR